MTAAKVGVAVATGSVGVLSEAIHSGLDLISSLVTFFVARASVRPADWDHPFGHGKIESISALFEAFLLLVAGGYIVFESLSKVTSESHHLHNVQLGLIVVAATAALNLFVYFQNRDVAREEESIAIETNAFHFLTDVFSSLAVVASLALVQFTGNAYWDPIVAFGIAAYVGWVGISQIRKCIAELSDTVLPQEEVSLVKRVLAQHDKEFINYHELKTRRAGAARHIDLHLTVCSEQRVFEAHETCDRIEDDLNKTFKEVQVNIHVEPCGNHSPECVKVCSFFKKPREFPSGTPHGQD